MKPCRYLGRIARDTEGGKCKGPEEGTCLCLRTVRTDSVAGEGRVMERMSRVEDTEPTGASSGRLCSP